MSGFWQKSVKWAVCAALLGSASAWAGNVEPQTAKQAAAAAKKARQIDAAKRATGFFGVLTTELAWQKGDRYGVLKAYRLLLDRTKDAAVAERAMEIAVGLRDYQQAEQIYQSWLKIGGAADSPALRRMQWVRSLTSGDYAVAAEGFAGVLDEAGNDEQRAPLLVMPVWVLVNAPEQSNALKDLVQPVLTAAKKYRDLPEAMIAEAVFSAYGGRDDDAVAALHRLAAQDVLPVQAEAVAGIFDSRYPEILERFLLEADAEKISSEWLLLKLEYLMDVKQDFQTAYSLLQKMLNKQADSRLYGMAAQAAKHLDGHAEEAEAHWQKAYQLADKPERSQVALMAASTALDQGRYAAVKAWGNKISKEQHAFPKLMLQLMSASKQEKWAQVEALLPEAKKLARAEDPQSLENIYLENIYMIQAMLALKSANPHAQIARLNALEKELPQTAKVLRKSVIYQRAILYADELAQPEKAVADLRGLLAEEPDSPILQNTLGYTLLSVPNADLHEALALVQKAHQKVPDSPAINDSIGWAYFRLGDAESALPYLEFAWKKDQEAEIAAHLGEVLLNLGRADEAQKVFEAGNLLKNSGRRVFDETVKRLGIVLPKP